MNPSPADLPTSRPLLLWELFLTSSSVAMVPSQAEHLQQNSLGPPVETVRETKVRQTQQDLGRLLELGGHQEHC